MDANLDVMNHHVMLMVYLNMNCDRMSHDHLRYDRQMMRHHDTSRMDEMILDGKMKIHHVSWRQCHRVDLTIDPACYDRTHLNRASHLMKDGQKMI
jgi:hypothetical protein